MGRYQCPYCGFSAEGNPDMCGECENNLRQELTPAEEAMLENRRHRNGREMQDGIRAKMIKDLQKGRW